MSGDGVLEVRKPFLEWLEANRIEACRTPDWCELEVDEEAGVIRIEQMWSGFLPDGKTREVYVIGKRHGTVMREFPLVQPMGAELAAVWERLAPVARQYRRDSELLREFAAAGGMLVTLKAESKLLLVGQKTISADVAQRITDFVGAMFPSVEVGVVTGIRAVLVETADVEQWNEPVTISR